MKKLVIPTIIIALTASPVLWAKTDWAKVTKAEPITRTVEHNTPSEDCWNEQVRYERAPDENNSYTGTILGGIIGGALGNAMGHRTKNKKIGTAIGVVLGASVGRDISANSRPRSSTHVSYRNERRCEMRDNITYEEEVVGYQVWYRYFGEKYKTRMMHQPGDKIKVRVKVEPF